MESKSFKIEHNVYRDTFSKASYPERGPSPQRGKRIDEASPMKRKYQQTQLTPGCKAITNETVFNHELGQVVENSCQLLGRLSGLFNNSELSDVRLVVLSGSGERREYPAHKLILCSASEVFKVMLTGKNWNECSTFEVCLNEDPSLSPVFELFLEYLYSGRIALRHSMVLNVLMLADKYDVKDLQEVCINYMCCHLVSTVEQNRAISWLQYGQYAGHKHLAIQCQQFICLNFYKVLSCPDFLSIEFDLLLSFLKQSDLVIPDEFILYQGVVQWWLSNYNQSVSDDCDIGNASSSDSKCFSDIETGPQVDLNASDFVQARELFSSIRFPLMTHTQLNAITSDVDRLQHSDFGNFHVHSLMSASSSSPQSSHDDRKLKVLLAVVEEYAKKALVLQDVAKSAIHLRDLCNYLKNTFDESQVTPRNYTNEIWSTTLCIDKFASLPQHEVRSVVFSSPSSSILPDETNPAWDWTVELFPKGVVFQRCIMIGLWRNVEVHGDTYNTVRLTLHCNQSKECSAWEKGLDLQRGQRNVTVCVLVTGVQDNVEHICQMVKRSLSFDILDRTRHMNDLVPYHLLNRSASCCRAQTQPGRSADEPPPSCTLLSGPEGDSLKVTIVIKPSPAFYFKQIPS